jgi:hypothetical protein
MIVLFFFLIFFYLVSSGGRLLNLLEVSVHDGHDALALQAQVGGGLLALHLGAVRVPLVGRHADELFIRGPGLVDDLVQEERREDVGEEHEHVQDLLHGVAGDADLHGSGHEVAAGSGGLGGGEDGSVADVDSGRDESTTTDHFFVGCFFGFFLFWEKKTQKNWILFCFVLNRMELLDFFFLNLIFSSKFKFHFFFFKPKKK